MTDDYQSTSHSEEAGVSLPLHSSVGPDVQANRRSRKWSRRELSGRLLWALAQPLFRLSPRPLWAWRRVLLRSFGARIGSHVHIYPSVRIAIPWNLTIGNLSAIGDRAFVYNLGPVTIGERTTVSHQAQICAGSHDHSQPDFPLLKLPVSIGNGVWICADAFVGPGTRVGDGAIVAARAVVVKDVASGTIVGGNPAKLLRLRSSPLQRDGHC
jgi:putative colanic acid biosynthesis acetyltransferase WcaF